MSINIQKYNKCYYSDSNEFNYNKKNINYYEDDAKIISVSSYDSIYINYKNSNSDEQFDKPNNFKQYDKPNNSDKRSNKDKRNKYNPLYYNPESGYFPTSWDHGQCYCSKQFRQSYNQLKLD